MAGVRGHLPSGEVSLSAGVALSVLQIIAAANHRVKITGISVFFKGTSPTDTPVKVELARHSTAGTFTGVTPLKNNDGDDETIQATGGKNASAEPTYGDILHVWEVHPQTGLVVFFPFGQEIDVKGAGRLGIRCTAAQAQTVAAAFMFEE